MSRQSRSSARATAAAASSSPARSDSRSRSRQRDNPRRGGGVAAAADADAASENSGNDGAATTGGSAAASSAASSASNSSSASSSVRASEHAPGSFLFSLRQRFFRDGRHGLALAPTHLFVSDRARNTAHIYVFSLLDAKMKLVRTIKEPNMNVGDLAWSQGRLYAVDMNARCIVVFDAGSGERLFHFGSHGSGEKDGEMEDPRSPCIDASSAAAAGGEGGGEGEVFVPDGFLKRINVFQADTGKFLRQIDASEGTFTTPLAVAVRGDELYVADYDSHSIKVLNRAGTTLLRSWGSKGEKEGEFMTPYAISLDGALVYILDTHNQRVQVFHRGRGSGGGEEGKEQERFLAQFGSEGEEDAQFDAPCSLCVDNASGRVFVADRKRVQAFAAHPQPASR